MLQIGILVGSTRPGRKALDVARWVHGLAQPRGDADYQIIDIADYHLPLLDEPVPPSLHQYSQPHTKVWADRIAPCDGFVFVTPEYNHGISGALKNALDFLYAEWNDKVVGFVSYGSVGGARSVEQLRLVCAELQMATVREQVMLSLFTDFRDMTVFTPDPRHEQEVHRMLDQLLAWTGALERVREERARSGASAA